MSWTLWFVIAGILASCVTTPITGRKAFIVTSVSEEAELGAQAYQEILAREPAASDSRWNAVIQRVGERIAGAAKEPSYQWEFRLIESKQVNAFCLPGGKVAVYTGILPMAGNEAALATIMGHEVAHATARHAGQRITQQFGTQLAMAGLTAVLGGSEGTKNQMILLAAMGIAQVGFQLPFSRSEESEADEIGLVYMATAGYDPREAPKLWSRMAAQESGGPAFLSTHPPSAERERALEQQVPRAMEIYEGSVKIGVGETW